MSRTIDMYREALQRWGFDAQANMVAEECAELIIAINKWRRAPIGASPDLRTIAEEIADVEIMLGQMKYYFGIHHLTEVLKNEKLDRLERRLAE